MKSNINSGIMKEFNKNIRQYTMFLVLIAIGIMFSMLTDGTFFSSRNISNLFLQSSAVAIVAIAVSLVLVAGHLDLSIGSSVALAGAVSATLMVKGGWETIPTILITLGVGVLIGCWQGFWVAFRGVPSFIVTLAGMLIFRGCVIGITRGMTIAPLNDSFKAIGQGYLPRIFSNSKHFNDSAIILGIVLCIIYVISVFLKRRSRKRYKLDILPLYYDVIRTVVICSIIMIIMTIMAMHLGVSYAVLIVMFLAITYSFISNNTSFGRYIYAIGGNKDAARLSGINIKKNIFILFLMMGVMSSISGIVYTARINAGTASAGTYMELDAIAAAIIGGTSTMGGEGSVFGAIIGALIMTSIDNGMSLMDMDVTYQYIIKGLVLLLAVWMDVATRKKSTI